MYFDFDEYQRTKFDVMETINFLDLVMSDFTGRYPKLTGLYTPEAKELFCDYAEAFYDIEPECSNDYLLTHSNCLN